MMNRQKTVMLALAWHNTALTHGVVDYARERHWHLVFQNGDNFQTDLRNWRGSGLICALEKDLLSCRSWTGVSLVSFLDLGDFAYPYRMVREDDYAIGCLAADYFMKRGYRNYAAYSISKRYMGFKETLAAKGFPCIGSGVLFSHDFDKLSAWLKSLPRPCALFCENDWDAADAVNAALWSGIKIPSEIAVLGLGNDLMVCHASAVSMSSIDARYYELGRLAASELDKSLDGAPLEKGPLLLPPSPLVAERQSTEFFAVENPRLSSLLEFMRRNSDSKITIGEMARRYHLSESSLYKLCVGNFGMSPKSLLLENRLRQVSNLLVATDGTMESIAGSCGFPTPGAMFSAFRRKFGCSPGVWRKRSKRNS